MCHDNEEWCKIWRGIGYSVQFKIDMRNLRNFAWALENLKKIAI